MDSDNLQDGAEGDNHSHGLVYASASTEMQKRPAGNDWEEGHHHLKSTRFDYATVAPQVIVPTPEEQASAFASQHNLLNVVNSFLRGGLDTISSLGASAALSGPGNEQTPPSESQGRTPTVVDPLHLGSCQSTPAASWVEDMPSRDSTPRPYARAASEASASSSVSLDSLLRDAARSGAAPDNRTFTASDPLPSHSRTPVVVPHSQTNPGGQAARGNKGKQPAAAATEPCSSEPQRFDFSTLSLPSWPGSSQTTTQNGAGSTSVPAPPLSSQLPANYPPTSGLPSSDVAGLGPLMSHFSEGMNRMLGSLQRYQTSFHEALQKQIDTGLREMTASLASIPKTTTQSGEMRNDDLEKLLGFPPQNLCRAPKKRKHFIPSLPESAPGDPSDVREHNMFMSCIRSHSLMLLGITSYKYLYRIKCELTDEEVLAFETDESDAIKISPTHFMVDCASNRDSAFNQTAAIVFADDFLDKVNNHSWYSETKVPLRYRQPHIVADAFTSHLAYIKLRYRQTVTGPRADPIQAQEANNARLQKSSRGSRKTRLLKMRLSALADDTELSKHVPLVKYLGTQGVSSDESEDGVRRTNYYPRVYPRWRNQRLAALMWQADAVTAENVSVPLGTRKKAGGLLRSRPHSNTFNDRAAAPIGLPRNCYDSDWLASLPPRIVHSLRIVDKDYDFGTGGPVPSAPLAPLPTFGPAPVNPSDPAVLDHSRVPAEHLTSFSSSDETQPLPVS